MNKCEYNKITREELLQLNEDDLMFITNPGRMGDEDGSTFIIKKDNKFIVYRVDGWMYPKTNENIEISENDLFKQFPKWYETLKNERNKDYNGKYKLIYMGFGNGLCIDKTIYNEYKTYLDSLVEEYLKDVSDKESLKYAALFNVWENAFLKMIKEKEYVLKK